MSTRSVPPWQFEWKRPEWLAPSDDESDFAVEGVPLSNSSAQLSLAEVQKWTGEADEDTILVDQVEAKDDEVSYFMSATLYSTGKSDASADVLLLELIQYKRASAKRIKYRMLRWPGSTLAEQEKQEEENSWAIASWIRAKPKPQAGLVSVVLCRRPAVGDEDHSASFADTMDLINLLSLGLDGASEVPIAPSVRPAEASESVRRGQIDDVEPTSLVMACLTTDGRVLLYSPQSILCPQDTKDDSHELGNGLASLLLGNEIHGQLEQSVLPLSEPLAVVPLSVPVRKTTTKQKDGDLNVIPEGIAIPEEDQDDFHEEDAVIVKHGLWEESFWDANVEASTAKYHTMDNVPKLMISAFDFIAVGGQGTRLRRLKRRKKIPPRTESSSSLGSESTDGEASMVSSKKRSSTADSIDSREQPGESKPRWVECKETGGFITFISLRFSAETKTVYLPFAPKQLSAVVWGEMHFVIVLGEESTAPLHAPIALAIRVDPFSVTNVPRGEPPSFSRIDSGNSLTSDQDVNRGDKNKSKQNEVCTVRRFHLIPIILPSRGSSYSEQVTAVAVSSTLTEPPAIALQYSSEPDMSGDLLVSLNSLQSLDTVPTALAYRAMGGYRRSGKKVERMLAIKTRLPLGNVARIPHSAPPSTTRTTWCKVGQGWSLFGVDVDVFFICWEGSTASKGAFVSKVHSEEEYEGKIDDLTTLRLFDPVCSAISPIQSSLILSSRLENNSREVRASSLQLPFTSPYKMPSFVAKRDGSFINDEHDVGDVVKDALDSLSVETHPTGPPQQAESTLTRQSLSYREKSIRLVRHCSSWTLLDDRKENTGYNAQVPVMLVQLGPLLREHFVLSLRKTVVDNEFATPFNQVLGWLSQAKNYFTAASVALDLLRDFDSLRDLRRAKEQAGLDDSRANLEGLLDGIVPLYTDSSISSDGSPPLPNESVLTQLADMTVGCLLKGGLSMSSTLENFVHNNSNYDSGRACLMLVSAAVCSLSRDPKAIMSVMGADYEWPADDKVPIRDLVWPMRSLFRVGVARDCLPSVLQLLNAAIPDEMRRRGRDRVTAEPPDAPEICRSIVSMVVASSAAELMLGLKDEATGKAYWDSLDHDTRLDLSLLSVDDTFPLLRQAEVRRWALDEMDSLISSGSPAAPKTSLRNHWLATLCKACLVNAGCDLECIVMEGSERSDKTSCDGTQEHFATHRLAIEALAPSTGSGGLDFDLLIPALLLLSNRNATWRDNSSLTTQSILDAACYMAGRHRTEEPTFAFDASRVMKQCALSGNISAGANLIGGKNGLVLKCCDVLIKGAEASMDDAEDYILNDELDKTTVWRKGRLGNRVSNGALSFELSDEHRTVLWLLDEYVVNIRTFGDFDTKHVRGKVDPVFAARSCFRAWFLLSVGGIDEATAWLVHWLRSRLGMDQDQVSRKRLACSALTCALLWPAGEEVVDIGELDVASDETLLANALNMESLFLVQLTQSCCGLVESVPPSFAREILRQVEVAEAKSKRLPSFHVDV